MSDELAARLVATRRDLHAHPELGYRETRTSALVAARLRELGFEVHEGIATTGVVGVLDSGRPGPVSGWRADMDALPIHEANDVPYRSANDGCMHACGHDVHTTVALGAAELVSAARDRVNGRVVFVFQPNEEGAPGAGPSGADAMVADGLLERFELDALYAMHCMPSLEVGSVGYTPGGVWASSDRFVIRVTGEQTHGAYPHLGSDAILAAGHLVVALQSIASRAIDTQQACVVSVCQLHAGNQFNVIPAVAELEGIVRTLDPGVRRRALERVRAICRGVAETTGTSVAVDIHSGAESVVNDGPLLEHAVRTLAGTFGADTVRQIPAQLGAEDFAAFSARVPSVYLLLGTRGDDPTRTGNPLHSPRFDVDERCLELGARAAAALLVSSPS